MATSSGNTTRRVYTDGACSGNPGPGGWAWALGPSHYASGFESHTTNQRMEIQAALEAIRALEGPLEVVSDSTYVVNCFRQKWWQGWHQRGWVNSQRKPVANRDLWEPLIDLVLARKNVSFSWVRGHGGDPMNELVDGLAVEATRCRRGACLPAAPQGAAADAKVVVDGGEGAATRGPAKRSASPRAKQLALPDAPTPSTAPVHEQAVLYLLLPASGDGALPAARALAAKKRALRFCVDEWMAELYGPDARPDAGEPTAKWTEERVQRCEKQIWTLCREALALGSSVVVELGTSQHRHSAFRRLAEQHGVTVRVLRMGELTDQS
jgi:ribonuclease HI